MKEFITLKLMQTGGYKVIERVDSRFYSLYQVLEYHWYQVKFLRIGLIDWLMDEKRESIGNEWVSIDKERGAIALYDVSASMDETYTGEYIDPEKRFEMTVKNFAEIIYTWEELRVSRPDIMLIVIHEDNHVSLETDPEVMQRIKMLVMLLI